MSRTAIEAALLAENKAKCSPPLPDGKVRAIARDIPLRYLSAQLQPDILKAAIEIIGVNGDYRERFKKLCTVLQRFRGTDPVVLPVERIGQEFECHHTLISRLRREGVVEGWLIPVRRSIPHRVQTSVSKSKLWPPAHRLKRIPPPPR